MYAHPLTPQPDNFSKIAGLKLDMDNINYENKRADSITNLNTLVTALVENQVALQEKIENQRTEIDKLRHKSADAR